MEINVPIGELSNEEWLQASNIPKGLNIGLQGAK